VDRSELLEYVGADLYRAACEWARHGGEVAWDVEAVEEMPCYGNLMLISAQARDGFGAGEWEAMWGAYRRWLESGDEPLAHAASYSLWVDWLEDPSTVERAWQAMIAAPPERRRTERLVEISGPVPWKLKAPLLDELARDPRFHPAIRKLTGARDEVLGQLDEDGAKALARRVGGFDQR
jgi:hypothetical protein